MATLATLPMFSAGASFFSGEGTVTGLSVLATLGGGVVCDRRIIANRSKAATSTPTHAIAVQRIRALAVLGGMLMTAIGSRLGASFGASELDRASTFTLIGRTSSTSRGL